MPPFNKSQLLFIYEQSKDLNNIEAATLLGIHRDTVRKAKRLYLNGELDDITPEPIDGTYIAGPTESPDQPKLIAQQIESQFKYSELLACIGDGEKSVFQIAKELKIKTADALALCEQAEADTVLSQPIDGVFRVRRVLDVTPEHDGNNLSISFRVTGQIPSADDLLAMANLQREDWELVRYQPNTWQMGAKMDDGSIKVTTLVQAKAEFRRKVLLPIEIQPVAPVEVHVSAPAIIQRRNVTNLKRAIILPDMQVGFTRTDQLTGVLTSMHDRQSLDVATQIVADTKPDIVVCQGDNLDLAGYSEKYPKTPEFYLTTQPAIVELAWIYGQIRQAVGPQAEIHWIEGNHESRLNRLLKINYAEAYQVRPAYELDQFPLISVERLIGTERLGIQYYGPYPYGEYWLNSRFVCIHGERVNGKSGMTTANVVQDVQHGMSQGHIHRREFAAKTFWTGSDYRVDEAWSFGTLAKVDRGAVPGFKSQQNWQQGVGDIWFETSGEEGYNVSPVSIFKGAAIYNGKKYVARSEAEIVQQIEADTRYNVRYGYLSQALAA